MGEEGVSVTPRLHSRDTEPAQLGRLDVKQNFVFTPYGLCRIRWWNRIRRGAAGSTGSVHSCSTARSLLLLLVAELIQREKLQADYLSGFMFSVVHGDICHLITIVPPLDMKVSCCT